MCVERGGWEGDGWGERLSRHGGSPEWEERRRKDALIHALP